MGILDSSNESSQTSTTTDGQFSDQDSAYNQELGLLNGNGFADEVELQNSQIGDSIDAYKSHIEVTDQSTSITNNNVSDFGAISGALALASQTSENNLNSLDLMLASASDFVFGGFETVNNFAELNNVAADRNAEFAESIFSQSIDFAGVQAENAIESANMSAARIDNAWYSANASTVDAFKSANDSIDNAWYSANQSVANAWDSSNQSILAISRDSIDTVERGITDANIRASNSVERGNENALASILSVVAGANQSVDETNADALAYVSEAQKTENERTTDTLLKWGIGGMAIVAAVAVMAKKGFK